MVAKADFTVEFPKTQKLQPKISHAEISGTEQPDQALVKTCIMFSQNDPFLKLKKMTQMSNGLQNSIQGCLKHTKGCLQQNNSMSKI